MAWNPEVYGRYQSNRFAPFHDLFALIQIKPGLEVIDLGCGAGEMAKELSEKLPSSSVLGIDSSAEMLEKANTLAGNNLRFEQATIEQQAQSGKKWDIVFSNAALQWVNDHETLFPELISLVKPGGQLLVQMPAQHHNIANKVIMELAGLEPFQSALQGFIRTSPVLALDDYAQLFFRSGSQSMTLYEKIYPLVLKDVDGLIEWLQGSTLTPYAERLHGITWSSFVTELRKRLLRSFPGTPVFYPFRRMIMGVNV